MLPLSQRRGGADGLDFPVHNHVAPNLWGKGTKSSKFPGAMRGVQLAYQIPGRQICCAGQAALRAAIARCYAEGILPAGNQRFSFHCPLTYHFETVSTT
jgi:hypothetical protein